MSKATVRAIIVVLILALAAMIAVSIWQNVQHARYRARVDRAFISNVGDNLRLARRALHRFLDGLDDRRGDTWFIEETANRLRMVDTMLRLHYWVDYPAASYPTDATWGPLSFEVFAGALGRGQYMIGGQPYDGVLRHADWTEGNYRFVRTLKEDLTELLELMQCTDRIWQIRADISTTELNEMLENFFAKWNPYETQFNRFVWLPGRIELLIEGRLVN